MPIPYRDDDGLDRLGAAAFLRIQPEPRGYRGALFLVDARGEPIEFAYNRIEIVQRFLWGEDQLRRHACRRLATTLFEVCPRVPALLLCRAEEVGSEIFLEDVRLSLPVARIADESAVVGQAAEEEHESDADGGLQLFWAGVAPAPETPERTLLDELARRGLLSEPFERAAVGLTEVYGHPSMVG
jgi:hypothetical protein